MRPVFPQTRQVIIEKGKYRPIYLNMQYNLYISILNKYKQTKCSNIKSRKDFQYYKVFYSKIGLTKAVSAMHCIN